MSTYANALRTWLGRLTLRRCSCGIVHLTVPPGAKTGETGAYWQCVCESTLFRPDAVTKRLLTAYAKQNRAKGARRRSV